MKLTILMTLVVSTWAFVPQPNTPTASTSLSACSRRAWLSESATSAALAAMVIFPQAGMAAPRPTYLTEPTQEFKDNEAKAADFKRQQLLIKKDFLAVLERLINEPNNEDALAADLKELQGLVKKTGGLPLGIKKEELFKTIRSKKAKGFWPTPVEIAYQSLISEISFQQSPNLEKDLGNFYQ